jgi:hypothetical protein
MRESNINPPKSFEMVTVLGGGAKNGFIKWAEFRDFFFFFPIA